MSKKLLNNKLILYLFMVLLIFSLSACKKNKPDKLEDEFSYLVGIWKWDSTFYKYLGCHESMYENMIYESESEFTLHIEESGYISFYSDNQLLNKKSITIDYFEEIGVGNRHVVFKLNNDSEDLISIVGSIQSSRVTRFPYKENDPGCETYLNYFSKE